MTTLATLCLVGHLRRREPLSVVVLLTQNSLVLVCFSQHRGRGQRLVTLGYLVDCMTFEDN